MSLLESDKLEAAMDCYKAALEADTRNCFATLGVANTLELLGKTDEAASV